MSPDAILLCTRILQRMSQKLKSSCHYHSDRKIKAGPIEKKFEKRLEDYVIVDRQQYIQGIVLSVCKHSQISHICVKTRQVL